MLIRFSIFQWHKGHEWLLGILRKKFNITFFHSYLFIVCPDLSTFSQKTTSCRILSNSTSPVYDQTGTFRPQIQRILFSGDQKAVSKWIPTPRVPHVIIETLLAQRIYQLYAYDLNLSYYCSLMSVASNDGLPAGNY